MKEFINSEKMLATLTTLFMEKAESFGIDTGVYGDAIGDYAFWQTEKISRDMHGYVHMADTRITGNLCNIRQDWETTKDFVKSGVRPWGRFDDIVQAIDDGTVSAKDHEKFQAWCADWFFTAFGTFGLAYNFGDFILSVVSEYENENAA